MKRNFDIIVVESKGESAGESKGESAGLRDIIVVDSESEYACEYACESKGESAGLRDNSRKKRKIIKQAKIQGIDRVVLKEAEEKMINQMKEVSIYSQDEIELAIGAVKSGTEEAVIIDAGLIVDIPGEEMVRSWNGRVKPEYRVPVPRTWSDLLFLKEYKSLPGISGGMWHTYASSAHDTVLDSPVVDKIFSEIAGTPNWCVRPERFRVNRFNKDDGYKSAHLEGPHVLSDETGISVIVCVTPGRTFTYYEGSNNDERAREIFRKMGGKTSMFVNPSQEQLKPWPRTTIRTSKPGQIIIFADSVAHEVSRLGESVSLFFSPFDPAKAVSEIKYYKGLNRKKALAIKKQLSVSPPLPTHLLLPGHMRQIPKEFVGMSCRDCEIIGSLFNITGAYWPSNKPTFFLMHMMAFNAFKHKFLPFCFDSAGKYNFEIITPDLLDKYSQSEQSEQFDQDYFEKLPFAFISEAEVQLMREKYTGIPTVAWPLIRYWTKDITMCSDNVSKRRGYIL
jgi:hypothetical protein